MSSPTTRALLEDAFYQVLDNKIFRLLLLLVLVLVAPVYLIGFRTDEISVLYGWKSLSYAELFRFFGRSHEYLASSAPIDVQAKAIQIYQSLIVESLGGTLGMVVCVSATAFFVPHMLEKGSADILFSKPVSRRTLLLSRYFAGLLFVSILAALLIGGIYFGLLVVSGYNDPGFLWGAFTLIYLFAILHAFSTAIGVFTRSTVAAILLSILLFMGSGCVHSVWQVRQWAEGTNLAATVRSQMQADENGDSGLPTIVDDAPKNWFLQALITLLDALHYTLPKTKDADHLARMLRKAVAGHSDTVVDPAGNVSITDAPAEFKLVSPAAPEAGEDGLVVDLERDPAVWSAKNADGLEVARIEFVRKTRYQERVGSGTGKPRRISANAAADDLVERISASGRASSPPVVLRRNAPAAASGVAATYPGNIDGTPAVFVEWSETAGTQTMRRRAAVFVFGDWLYEVSAAMDADWLSESARNERFNSFLTAVQLARTGGIGDPDEWYEERFGWTSELPYNAFLSIGTSLAFAIVMLWLARLKLERIDF